MYRVGQAVIERRHGSSPGSGATTCKTRIERIEPSGELVTETGNLYTAHGLAVDRDSRAWGSIRDAEYVDRRGHN